MPTHEILAAGLFDSPWIVAILLIGSAVTNWLASRRQKKLAERPPDGSEPPPAAKDNPEAEVDLEEMLRRLMGEEPRAPIPAPSPPPLIRAAGHIPPAFQEQEAEEANQEEAFQPSLPALASASAVSALQAQAALRFEQSRQRSRPAAAVARHAHPARRTASRWRDPRSARHAFVASVVFAPPKSLESDAQ